MMQIEFKQDQFLLKDLQEKWNNIEDAFFLTHYELAALTNYAPTDWRTFLMHPEVAAWMESELGLMREAKLRLLLKDITSNSKSTGLPQLINTLSAGKEKQGRDDSGPVFIYMHVPLNSQEQHAPNVQTATPDTTENLFIRRK